MSIFRGFFRRKAGPAVLVPSSSFFASAVYPKNLGTTCGYTAAALLLSYWQFRGAFRLPERFLEQPEEGGEADSAGFRPLRLESPTLQDELLSYGHFRRSWGWSIASALRRFGKKEGLPLQTGFSLYGLGMRRELREGRPVIAFGLVPAQPAAPRPGGWRRFNLWERYLAHAFIVYGYDPQNRRYLCHFGWEGYEAVWLRLPLLGSSTRMRIKK